MGWLIEEIEEANHAAVKGLIQKGIIKVINTDNINIDDTMTRLIQPFKMTLRRVSRMVWTDSYTSK